MAVAVAVAVWRSGVYPHQSSGEANLPDSSPSVNVSVLSLQTLLKGGRITSLSLIPIMTPIDIFTLIPWVAMAPVDIFAVGPSSIAAPWFGE